LVVWRRPGACSEGAGTDGKVERGGGQRGTLSGKEAKAGNRKRICLRARILGSGLSAKEKAVQEQGTKSGMRADTVKSRGGER